MLDTNVLVSGMIHGKGSPGKVLDGLFNRRFSVIVSEPVYVEYAGVLGRAKFNFSIEKVRRLLEFIEKEGVKVVCKGTKVGLPDEDDEKFLETAKMGKVDYLATGNMKDFPARLRGGIEVISPAEFSALLGV